MFRWMVSTGTAGTSGMGAASGSGQGTSGYPEAGQNSRGGNGIGWLGLLGLARLLGLRRRSTPTTANMNR
jgi:MYXO-CTERM domain-containing protein